MLIVATKKYIKFGTFTETKILSVQYLLSGRACRLSMYFGISLDLILSVSALGISSMRGVCVNA